MIDEEPDDFPSEPRAPESGGPVRESVRSRLESIIPEILKRAVEIGVEKARESPDNLKQFVQDLKVPKEVAHLLFQQIDDTKNGLYRVVAKEIRDVLEQTNFSGELQKLLTTVQFEINTTIRFTPNDGRDAKKNGGDAGDAKTSDEDEATDREDSGDPNDADGGDEKSTTGRQSLPRPEIKTAVRVRRDERSRRGSRSGA
jgi:hypothetical protein